MKRPFIIKITGEYLGDNEIFVSTIDDIDMDTISDKEELEQRVDSIINYLQLKFIEQLTLRVKFDREFRKNLNI